LRFWLDGLNTVWIAATLKTITSDHKYMPQISTIVVLFCSRYNDYDPTDIVRQSVREVNYSQWMDLDRVLI
jgi:hypothetical protein